VTSPAATRYASPSSGDPCARSNPSGATGPCGILKEIVEVVGTQGLACPQYLIALRSSVRIKRSILTHRSTWLPRTIAANIRPCPIDGAVRVRAISDQVAQAQDPIVAALRVVEHGLRPLPVSMDVAQDQIWHSACRSSLVPR
jgi:hypothetical protein